MHIKSRRMKMLYVWNYDVVSVVKLLLEYVIMEDISAFFFFHFSSYSYPSIKYFSIKKKNICIIYIIWGFRNLWKDIRQPYNNINNGCCIFKLVFSKVILHKFVDTFFHLRLFETLKARIWRGIIHRKWSFGWNLMFWFTFY